jgi:hypothetical protein
MSWGKIYETSHWGCYPTFLNIGFNKINAISTCIAGNIAFSVTNSNVKIDSTIQTIDRTEF